MMNDQHAAARWAAELLTRSDWCILDTETTGLGAQDQIVDLAVLDPGGHTLFNQRIRPTVPISDKAFEKHGISTADLQFSQTFDQIFLDLLRAIGRRDIIIFNAEYDLRLIRQTALACGFPLAFPTSDRRQCRVWVGGGGVYCAMLQYAAWFGDWNVSRNSYTWKPLPGGDHSAIGDCRATLDLIHQMAANWCEVAP